MDKSATFQMLVCLVKIQFKLCISIIHIYFFLFALLKSIHQSSFIFIRYGTTINTQMESVAQTSWRGRFPLFFH